MLNMPEFNFLTIEPFTSLKSLGVSNQSAATVDRGSEGEGAGAKTRILGNFLKFSLLRVVVQIMFFRALKASNLAVGF